ncbi:hypothetical protein V6Z12_A07G126800 [Gossypium hirsutum]
MNVFSLPKFYKKLATLDLEGALWWINKLLK